MMPNPRHTCLWKIHSKSRVDGCTNSVFDFINMHVHTENVIIFQLHKPLCLLLDLLTRLAAFTPVSFVDKLSFFDFVHLMRVSLSLTDEQMITTCNLKSFMITTHVYTHTYTQIPLL